MFMYFIPGVSQAGEIQAIETQISTPRYYISFWMSQAKDQDDVAYHDHTNFRFWKPFDHDHFTNLFCEYFQNNNI